MLLLHSCKDISKDEMTVMNKINVNGYGTGRNDLHSNPKQSCLE